MDAAELRKIIWLDSCSQDGWHDPERQNYGPVKATTVGYVMHEDTECVALAASVVFGENFQASGTMTIPKACILSDKVLAKR